MQWGYPPNMIRQMVSSGELTELMAYERLYPSGFDLDNKLNAHVCRQVAYGALQDPSGDLDDHKLYHEPTLSDIVLEPDEPVATTADAIKDEQMQVLNVLDMIF